VHPNDAWLKSALSPLQFQLAHEIAFSKRRALVAENVVSCGRMEKEVTQREPMVVAYRPIGTLVGLRLIHLARRAPLEQLLSTATLVRFLRL
jgi:hypothetical protein